MKILLLGSLISNVQQEALNRNSKEKASVAPNNYETMLTEGLVENGADVEALSVPAVAAYPHSIYKYIKNKHELIGDNIRVTWIPFINIQGLKQLSIKINTWIQLRRWLKANEKEKEKVVLMYSVYPPYSEPAIRLCKKHGCHISCVIADLPEYMYTWKSLKGFRGFFSRILSNRMIKLQDKCNSYILFTRQMAKRMNIENKPYIVSEGICDCSIFDEFSTEEKYKKKTIVYGGNLSRLYGIRDLIMGFMKTSLDVELHIYGTGEDENYVKECQKKDSRVKFFGKVERKKLLFSLKKAQLLVVNKPTKDDYSNYSFSSKIMEYLSSGTPLLTTKVGGMPEEYYKHCFFIVNESIDGIKEAIESVFALSEDELKEKGANAESFVNFFKNKNVVAQKILFFLRDNI